jgi:predicted CXXCH cytochrome family protein
MILPPPARTRTAFSSDLRSVQALVVCVAIALLASVPMFAGDWHYGSHLVCSDCHTNHNSASGQPMRYDNVPNPAAYLLRSDTTQTLCLSCHDGSTASAPDVMGTVTYVSESAAGAFANPGGVMVTTAHNLNTPTPQIPPGGTKPMVLTCTTCHDPHGNDNYRNLRPDPASIGANISVVVKQATIANGNNPAAVYVPSNVLYKSGASLWCQNCHGNPLDWGHHSDDKPLFGSTIASYSRWTSVSLPRVPVLNPSDNAVPSTDDRVMCLSCHKAHGSPNSKALIHADGATLDSTCEECHDP